MSPFVATFFISIFVLLMQFLWKYIDDLVGKGIEFAVFAKLLIYVAASLVPMALPLSILLSSLMTFGNLGENYELVAFKSAGISLKRILRPLSFVIFILSIVAFLFSNYWLPVANLKSKSLLYDIKQQKPTMDIQPGIFSNELEDYTIRVQNKKEIDGVEHLYDVIIYDHSDGPGNRNVTTAKEGIMSNSADQRYLQMTLLNGVTYEEEKNPYLKQEFTLKRSIFKESILRTDMSQFDLNRTDEELFKNGYKMLNMSQLANAIDTLTAMDKKNFKAFKKGLRNSSFLYSKFDQSKFSQIKIKTPIEFDKYFHGLTKDKQKQAINTASNLSRNSKSRLSSMNEELRGRSKYVRSHEIEWHKKLTLPFACIILFLIGAPLGAIIRKGGLGMPIIISVAFFLLFHILSISGEKMAKEGAITSFEGMWMASAILLPVGVFFSYKATKDSALFNFDAYGNFFKSIFKKK
jgi:lipopolysaccharide export system permease protein